MLRCRQALSFAGDGCTYVFLGWMSSELSGEDVQYVLIHPSALGECGEREIVRVNFSQTCGMKLLNKHRRYGPTHNGNVTDFTAAHNLVYIIIGCFFTVLDVVWRLVISVVCESGSFSLQRFRLQLGLRHEKTHVKQSWSIKKKKKSKQIRSTKKKFFSSFLSWNDLLCILFIRTKTNGTSINFK